MGACAVGIEERALFG